MDIKLNRLGFKTAQIVVPDDYGRDAKKVFLLTEWPAARAEEWAIRALIAYNRGGGKIPSDVIGGGMEAIFWLGIETFLRGTMQSDEIIPIWNELLECVQIIRDPSAKQPDGQPVAHPLIADSDIFEIKTRFWLRSEVLRLHTNFSMFDAVSSLISAIMTSKGSPTTKTSPDSSP